MPAPGGNRSGRLLVSTAFALPLLLIVLVRADLVHVSLDDRRIGIGPAEVVKSNPGFGERSPFPAIAVRRNKLIDGRGRVVRLLGVNRPGTEYECVENDGIFEGPSDSGSIRAMKAWGINAVRVPLNESCWLGLGYAPASMSGDVYRAAVRDYVTRLQEAGLYVIVDLHWAAPGDETATGLIPMPDRDHAIDFWRSVAAAFGSDRGILFDLYNEPHTVGWDCWQHGCTAEDRWFGQYEAVGMAELVAAVRGTGTEQPILLGGLDWATDLSEWARRAPSDPARALVASNHTYDFHPCNQACKAVLRKIAKRYPVVTSELGESDCNHDYIDRYMRWADRRGISYLGWAWFAPPDATCESGPTLIQDYSGRPTPFGKGLRDHLRRLGRGVASRSGA